MSHKFTRQSPETSEADVMPTEQSENELLENSDQFEDLEQTFAKLKRDEPTRGDLKILARAFKELRYAFKVFTPYRRHRKVTVFGSARTKPGNPDYDSGVEFGRLMAEAEWYVLTGAGGGAMEAAHVGAGREMSMGVNIMLPFEQSANPIIQDSELLVNLKYFFTRKLLFIKEVHAVVCYPGGFGTQDEAFETLTLIQTGKRDMMPVVLIEHEGGTYWSKWLAYVEAALGGGGLISPSDTSLFKVCTDPSEAVDEILWFYSAYHSMRYVRGKLVMRLLKEPNDEYVALLNKEFSDIIVRGEIEKCDVHPLEADDQHLTCLPRLRFEFNRRDLGRFREMIDHINTHLGPEDSRYVTNLAEWCTDKQCCEVRPYGSSRE